MNQLGTIKTIVDRGFGFITSGDLDYFFHRADLADGTEFDDIRQGDEVSFEPVEPSPPKGKRASLVRLAAAAPEIVA